MEKIPPALFGTVEKTPQMEIRPPPFLALRKNDPPPTVSAAHHSFTNIYIFLPLAIFNRNSYFSRHLPYYPVTYHYFLIPYLLNKFKFLYFPLHYILLYNDFLPPDFKIWLNHLLVQLFLTFSCSYFLYLAIYLYLSHILLDMLCH